MRGGNFDIMSDTYAMSHFELCSSGQHVGDIGNYKVKKSANEANQIFSIWDNDSLIAMLVTFISNGDCHEIRNIWVAENYRGQKLMSKFLWYLKTRENFSKMLLGPIHSLATQLMVKNGLARFEKSWFKDGEKKPFSIDTLDQFYDHLRPTGWQLMLENDGDFSSWPKFNNGASSVTFIEESFDWIVNEYDI